MKTNGGLHPLRSKNLLWYFLGQGSSLFGSWLQYIALGWLTYHLTGSATFLGIVSLVGGLPLLVLPPFIGGLIDRANKKKLLLIIQSLFFLQASTLTLFTITSHINYPLILILSLMHGIIFSLDQPLRQALIPCLLTNKDDLSGAIAWNAFLNNVIKITAPLAAGLIILQCGEGLCFFIDAMSVIPMIFAIYKIEWQHITLQTKKMDFWKSWRKNLAYIANMKMIFHTLIFAFIFSSTLCTYTVLMPIISQSTYNGNSSTQGYLLAASSVGAVLASLFMTRRSKNFQYIVNTILISSLLSAGALFMLVSMPSLSFGLLAIAILGASVLICSVSINTLLQSIVAEDKRGIVMSFFTTAYLGAIPLSNFTASLLTEYLGIKTAIITLIAVCCLGILYYSIEMFSLNKIPCLSEQDNAKEELQS